MVQKFVDDAEENKFFAVWEALISRTMIDLQAFFDDAYKSPELGRALYDAEGMALYNIIQRDLFVRAFYSIIEAEAVNGTIDGILNMLYAIFGADATITVDVTPLHLIINISSQYQQKKPWVTLAQDGIYEKTGVDEIVFSRILADITDRDLYNLLLAMTNQGSYIEFTLIRG